MRTVEFLPLAGKAEGRTSRLRLRNIFSIERRRRVYGTEGFGEALAEFFKEANNS